MNSTKTVEELALMREGGQKLGKILEQLLASAIPGENLLRIEDQAQHLIREAGGAPSFQTVPGYKWATCLCVNDAVVHGIPFDYLLKDNDILTIDVGILYKGYHTDTAWTKAMGNDEDTIRFLKIGQEALWKGVTQARPGNRIGHISQAIQSTIEDAGYGIVKTLVGHGVGYELHEPPQIPNYLRGTIEETLSLKEGMTFAIEPIYAMGKGDIEYTNRDGWTLGTKDRSLSAVFEHTVVVTTGEPELLTKFMK